jgi:hypothetical protein
VLGVFGWVFEFIVVYFGCFSDFRNMEICVKGVV